MTRGQPEPIFRPAARVLLLDPDNRLLLARWEVEGRAWWATPGGGLNSDETYEEAAKREFLEEVGLKDVALGPLVWRREHVYSWKGATHRQTERFFECRVDFFEVWSMRPTGVLAPEEIGHRWWSLDEIWAATNEVFAPRRLASFLGKLIDEGPPDAPIDVGV
jgi:8-oxo-dGTP pyrophosphatase MutT (NUDIX family)